jgi:hypothetical protein
MFMKTTAFHPRYTAVFWNECASLLAGFSKNSVTNDVKPSETWYNFGRKIGSFSLKYEKEDYYEVQAQRNMSYSHVGHASLQVTSRRCCSAATEITSIELSTSDYIERRWHDNPRIRRYGHRR